MKKTTHLAASLCLASLFIISCTHGPSTPQQTDKPLTVADARKMVNSYASDTTPGKPVFLTPDGDSVVAFNIEASTLAELTALDGFSGLRLYPVINSYQNGVPVYSIMIVPRGTDSSGVNQPNILIDGKIFDYFPVCPKSCPTDSTKL